MRFVLGLASGVVLALLVAALLTPVAAENSQGMAPTDAAEVGAEVLPQPTAPALVEHGEAPAAAAPATLSEQVFPEPAVPEQLLPVERLSELTVPELTLPEQGLPVAAPVATTAPSIAQPPPAAVPGPTAAEPGSAQTPVAVSTPSESAEPTPATAPGIPSGQLSVWRPFHSEASAEGFARRLSSQLGYPFTVLRVAAAEYHVVFDYADASERDLLQQQIATLTGRQP